MSAPIDIFISYSSYDREKALTLAGELRRNGYEVWMDQDGIGGAQNWSSEIVDAINKTKTVLFLISKNSVTSHNCAKEIHLANEKYKNILPVVLEKTPLPVLFEYPLVGLQRVPYERTEAILQALEVLKSGKTVLEAMSSHSRIDDGIIRLAVLPFEDQSPGGGNDWLASGMTDELINTLGSLERMRVNPKGDVLYYKKNRPKLEEIAADLKCRYLVDGTVQKAGERTRIKVSLTDARERIQLWHEKYDGMLDDIFDLQDKTCFAIAEALKLTLTLDDEKKIEAKPTENAEAYELWLKGREYFIRFTRSDNERALGLYEAALRLDPSFADAHLSVALTSLDYYHKYSRDEEWIAKAHEHILLAESVTGETAPINRLRSTLARMRGHQEEALAYAERAVQLDPKYPAAYEALGYAYRSLHRREDEVIARKQAVQLWESSFIAHFNYLIVLAELDDPARLAEAARTAFPVFERHLRLTPDDHNVRVQYAKVLGWAGEHDRSLAEARTLEANEHLDGHALYNLAGLYFKEGKNQNGLSALRKAVERGYRNIDSFRHMSKVPQLHDMPEFAALIKELEEKIANEQHG